MGDDAYEVATNVDQTTGQRSMAWNSSAGEIYFTGEVPWLPGDTISIPDAQGKPQSFTVEAIAPFDSANNRTRVEVKDLDGNLGGFDEAVVAAAARKTFDVDVNVGIFGLTVNDGFIDFDAGLGITAESYLDMAQLGSNTLPEFDVDLDGDFEVAVYLPVELSGALSGLNVPQAVISAFTPELPGDFGLNEAIFSIPQSLRFEGFNELLQMRGISLEMILDAIQFSLDELVAGPLQTDIPLAGVSLNELLGGEGVGFVEELNAAIGDVRTQVNNLGELEAKLEAELDLAIRDDVRFRI